MARATPDHIHAITALISALGNFLIGVVTAFVNAQGEKTNVVKLENEEIE